MWYVLVGFGWLDCWLGLMIAVFGLWSGCGMWILGCFVERLGLLRFGVLFCDCGYFGVGGFALFAFGQAVVGCGVECGLVLLCGWVLGYLLRFGYWCCDVVWDYCIMCLAALVNSVGFDNSFVVLCFNCLWVVLLCFD